ncbi:hypothetical protein [Allokutzneria albata]|uniref:hypothetical protein n=1 Tax=Allokutzneria albata TaxID=211114 RepID=UPI0012DDB8E6|nr:hypothetical protein [Allokutzneria albata]
MRRAEPQVRAARHYTMWDEGYSGWCVAEKGRLLRYACCSQGFPEASPVDAATGRALFLLPTAFDAGTRAEGTGVLAVPPAPRNRRRGVLHLGGGGPPTALGDHPMVSRCAPPIPPGPVFDGGGRVIDTSPAVRAVLDPAELDVRGPHSAQFFLNHVISQPAVT